ncbi:hypothetical protein ACRALDRAFT_207263 [Sodiomyces alcalophilus JCM 7366]|uniref:uncharacterized protein n=1 Tax=Sodiomyces alcalophilus JCM 7366 TaxID=591952 RepID=UPI0039B49FBD
MCSSNQCGTMRYRVGTDVGSLGIPWIPVRYLRTTYSMCLLVLFAATHTTTLAQEETRTYPGEFYTYNNTLYFTRLVRYLVLIGTTSELPLPAGARVVPAPSTSFITEVPAVWSLPVSVQSTTDRYPRPFQLHNSQFPTPTLPIHFPPRRVGFLVFHELSSFPPIHPYSLAGILLLVTVSFFFAPFVLPPRLLLFSLVRPRGTTKALQEVPVLIHVSRLFFYRALAIWAHGRVTVGSRRTTPISSLSSALPCPVPHPHHTRRLRPPSPSLALFSPSPPRLVPTLHLGPPLASLNLWWPPIGVCDLTLSCLVLARLNRAILCRLLDRKNIPGHRHTRHPDTDTAINLAPLSNTKLPSNLSKDSNRTTPIPPSPILDAPFAHLPS